MEKNNLQVKFKIENSFDYPQWEKKKLEDIAVIVMGQSPNSIFYTDNIKDTVLIQGNADMKDGKIIPRVYTSHITKESLPGDIILSVRAPVGALAKTNIKACIGRGVCAIRGNDYLYHYLVWFAGSNGWKQISQGSIFDSVNSTDIKNLLIPVPSLPEQQRIAEFFSLLDDRIDAQTNKLSLLRDQKKGYIQKIFSQELRFKADNGKEYPKWEPKKLDDLANKITTGKLDANAMKVDGKYRFYTCAKNYYAIDEYAFDTEALLVSGNGANVGYIHYYKGKFNAYQRTYVLSEFKENVLFLQYALEALLPERINNEKSTGSTPYIVMSTLTDMVIHVPSSEEQEKIASIFSCLDQKIKAEEQKLLFFKAQKQGYLQQVFAK